MRTLILPVIVALTLSVAMPGGTTPRLRGEAQPRDARTRNPKHTIKNPKASCNLFPCHGLQFECHRKPLKPCPTVYTPGDFCRQFARCEVVKGNVCQLAPNPKLTACVKCMLMCKARDCDARCRKKLSAPPASAGRSAAPRSGADRRREARGATN